MKNEDHEYSCKQEEAIKRMEQLKKTVNFHFKFPLFNDFFIKPDQYIELVPTTEEQ